MIKLLISNHKTLDELEDYDFDKRYTCDKEGQVYLIKGKDRFYYFGYPMKPFVTIDGYVEYVLTTKYGSKQHIQAQRVCAGLYLDPPHPSKTYVNHKNGIREDNRVENLEWVSQSENMKHSWDNLRRNPNRTKYKNK